MDDKTGEVDGFDAGAAGFFLQHALDLGECLGLQGFLSLAGAQVKSVLLAEQQQQAVADAWHVGLGVFDRLGIARHDLEVHLHVTLGFGVFEVDDERWRQREINRGRLALGCGIGRLVMRMSGGTGLGEIPETTTTCRAEQEHGDDVEKLLAFLGRRGGRGACLVFPNGVCSC